MEKKLPTQDEISIRSTKITRRRAVVLCSIYVLFLLHLLHWTLYGRTVSPAELNETMFTIEQGVVTVGTILLVLILLSVLLFGRFFCSWGCHILALEDFASWLLGKVGIKPKPVRSRLLPFAALGALLYMFVWPTVVRLYEGRVWKGLRVLSDEEGLGSFTTEEFTRNLPGPLMTTVTFLVVGGAIVWLMGSRGFCRYVCPYGALFAGVDRFSPAGIQLVGDCNGCGECTASCTSHIRVHHEIKVHGRVVTPGCLKDLDCVMSCPQDALKFGYSKPPLLASFSNFTKPEVRWAWTWPQEIIGAVICIGTLLATRNLYGEIPFLLAVTLGVIAGWMAVTTIKLLSDFNMRVGRFQLKRNGQYSISANYWVATVTVVGLLIIHSGWIRWHESMGQSAWSDVQSGDETQISEMTYHLHIVIDYALWRPPYADRMLADLWMGTGKYEFAIPHLERLLSKWPENEFRQQQLSTASNLIGSEPIK